eukprot:1692092-Rhodomonas_salina.1
MNRYFPKGQYKFCKPGFRMNITLPSDEPATQRAFEASFRKLLENPCIKEGWGPMKKPDAAREACCVQ